MTEKLKEFIENYKRVRIIGGCCGTDPLHIGSMREMLDLNHDDGIIDTGIGRAD